MSEKGEIKSNPILKFPGKETFSRKNVGKSVHDLLDGSFLTRSWFMRSLPFIIFLLFLGVVYITNIFHVERTKRQIDDLEEQLRELRYEYITSRSKLMYESKPSEISLKLKETGISESLDPPKKIIINNTEKQAKP
jgi:hypothetical protein